MSNILAIDIGTSKVTALVARWQDNSLSIMGSGIVKSQGVRKGTIVNIDDASDAIIKATTDAFNQAGVRLDRATVSISGAYVKSLNSFGIATVPTKDITVKDVNRVMQAAVYNASIPSDYEVLHVLPYNFKVDGQSGIQDPVGMNGSRLEVSVHMVIAQKSGIENLRRTVRSADIEPESVVLSGYAASIAVLNSEEKELGVCVVDIGAGTSELIIHHGNALRYNDHLPVGGINVTNDLTMALRTSANAAEQIKIEHGDLLGSTEGYLEISKSGSENSTPQQVPVETVLNVIAARIDETLMLLASKLDKSGFKNQLGAGVVITGGVAKHRGLQELASPIFGNIPVRVAKPRAVNGLLDSLRDSAFSVALGLVRYATGEYTLYELEGGKTLKTKFAKNLQKISLDIDSDQDSSSYQKVTKDTNQIDETDEKASIADIMVSRVDSSTKKPLPSRIWEWLTKMF